MFKTLKPLTARPTWVNLLAQKAASSAACQAYKGYTDDFCPHATLQLLNRGDSVATQLLVWHTKSNFVCQSWISPAMAITTLTIRQSDIAEQCDLVATIASEDIRLNHCDWTTKGLSRWCNFAPCAKGQRPHRALALFHASKLFISLKVIHCASPLV